MRLQRLLSALPNAFIRRLRRERYKKPTWKHSIPDSHKLSEGDITSFVECLKPAVFLSMYSKMGSMDAAIALQQMAQVRPELVLPQLLEKTYTALDTLIEPHQLVATVSCMVSVSKSLLTSSKFYPEGPSHLLPLLSAMLPGIDPNDFSKCMVSWSFEFLCGLYRIFGLMSAFHLSIIDYHSLATLATFKKWLLLPTIRLQMYDFTCILFDELEMRSNVQF